MGNLLPKEIPMSWHVYLLRLENGTIYVGSTNDLNRRWEEHVSGRGSFATQQSRPIELIYTESYADRRAAMARERQLIQMVVADESSSNFVVNAYEG